ncbi:hypothetical protein FGG08_003566 [Glutinoglossum americanum]|uniref:Calcium channel YVC1-like C-terminal transmembrane domain-containing protein n=1 Tax=Glutinoglossum americanum TaxID=1670608 RepID=A0A9P8L0I2_9PEZI|nr:hypothetical protein FGG08_003566 [Glutinoglossum americanum]
MSYFVDAIDYPHTFEQLRNTSVGQRLRPLVASLSEGVHHPAIIAALLVLKWHFSALEPDDRRINETRGLACEIVAWRFLARLSERDIVDFLLYELPQDQPDHGPPVGTERGDGGLGLGLGLGLSGLQHQWRTVDENTPLLTGLPVTDIRRHRLPRPISHVGSYYTEDCRTDTVEDDPTPSFIGLNAMEIAVVVNAKKFLSQRAVQMVVNGIWSGRIVFWESMSVHTTKKAHFYNERYQKAFEVLFFASFLALYYAVLVERNPHRITSIETLLYIWIAAFAYDEFSEFRDAGRLFYAADFLTMWDLGIVGVGIAFIIAHTLLERNGRLRTIASSFISDITS